MPQTSVPVIIISYALTAVAAYLLGSVSFSIIITKLFAGTDVRRHGSGNAGATNVLRTVGKLPAILTFAADFLKCVVAILLALLVARLFGYSGELRECLKYVAGIACMTGHIFPVYFAFKGGKGVTTAAAIMLLLDWRVFLIAISLFILLVLITRYVSLGSVCAALSLPLLILAFQLAEGQKYAFLNAFLVAFITAVLVVKHRANIVRLCRGTESKVHSKKGA